MSLWQKCSGERTTAFDLHDFDLPFAYEDPPADAAYVMLAYGPLIITSGPPPMQARAGTPYSFQITANWPPPIFFYIEPQGGTPPPGLTLDADGLLVGTPNTAGTFRFAIGAMQDYSLYQMIGVLSTKSMLRPEGAYVGFP